MRAKRDGNHTTLRRLFEQLGCSTAETHMVGGGFQDIVVGCARQNLLVEVKMPGHEGDLTPAQELFHATWKGAIEVVSSQDDVVALVTRTRRSDNDESRRHAVLQQLWTAVQSGRPITVGLRAIVERTLADA